MTKRYLEPEWTESGRKMLCLEMRLASGNQKWKSKTGTTSGKQEKRKSFWAGGRMTPETASLRQSTWNQLKQTVELPSGIARESGKSRKKTAPSRRRLAGSALRNRATLPAATSLQE
jgi:hypothetical protein